MTFGDYAQPVAIKGIQKLVNRFLKCLLTPLGTDIGDAEYGTNLMYAFAGNVEPGTLNELATMAVRDTELKIREYDSQKSSPTDERLAGVEIDNINIDSASAGFTMKLIIRNVAGTRALTAVPLELD